MVSLLFLAVKNMYFMDMLPILIKLSQRHNEQIAIIDILQYPNRACLNGTYGRCQYLFRRHSKIGPNFVSETMIQTGTFGPQ